ncbi:tetratricopeptide repeat protein, partial [Candidatus Pacearchaeota archaeon]|nr:tetratricopeptide repeat protein [Candidatus Pacearchaeota archaeon]
NITPLDKEKFLGIAYRTIGISFYKQEKCEKAMEYISKSMNAEITDPRTNKYEGDVYKCLGKDEKALDSYNYAIEFEENFLEARIARGEILYKKGELSKALEDYNKAIELSPNNSELYKTRGDILIKISDKNKEAEKDYRKALELILKK